jgi:PD-(D/E)XK nuclease superfamily
MTAGGLLSACGHLKWFFGCALGHLVKLMMLAFLSLSRVFHVLSEAELAQGYCDLFLAPSGQVPDARYAWVLELKYLPATARRKDIEAAFAQAGAQLGRYMSDSGLLSIVSQGKEMRAGTLVFVSGREVLFRSWEPGDKPASARGKAPRPKGGARRPAKSAGTRGGRRPGPSLTPRLSRRSLFARDGDLLSAGGRRPRRVAFDGLVSRLRAALSLS